MNMLCTVSSGMLCVVTRKIWNVYASQTTVVLQWRIQWRIAKSRPTRAVSDSVTLAASSRLAADKTPQCSVPPVCRSRPHLTSCAQTAQPPCCVVGRQLPLCEAAMPSSLIDALQLRRAPAASYTRKALLGAPWLNTARCPGSWASHMSPILCALVTQQRPSTLFDSQCTDAHMQTHCRKCCCFNKLSRLAHL